MANTPRYIAASGSNTLPFDTWAKAATSTTTALSDVITASSAGDDIYIDKAFSLSNASAQTYTFKGTATAPTRVFSCTTITNNPPLTADLGTGASITTTGANSITIAGYVYIYGCTFNCGTGTTSANMVICNGNYEQIFDSCAINNKITTNQSLVQVGSTNGSKIVFINTPVTVAGDNTSILNFTGSSFYWKNTAGPAISNANTQINNGIGMAGSRNGWIICDGVDFSGTNGIASGKNIVQGIAAASTEFVQFINCKYTAGALIARPASPGSTIDQIIMDTGATNYKQQRDTYQGTLTASTTVYNNATDGTTPISWQVVTTANANPQSPFECFQIVQWAAAGTYASSKVFITSATASLKTNDVWVDVEYLGSSYALGSPATSFGAGSGSATLPQIPAGTTPGTLASASPAWGHGGLGNDYQLAIPSFTTSAAGYVRFTVKVGKASLTVNIDPAVTIA